MAGKNIKIHQPGVVETEAPDEYLEETNDDDGGIDASTIADVVAASADDEARIEAEVQRRVALRTQRPAGGLPHPSEIDATKIKRSVLTIDGYVVPAPPPAKSIEDQVASAILKTR